MDIILLSLEIARKRAGQQGKYNLPCASSCGHSLLSNIGRWSAGRPGACVVDGGAAALLLLLALGTIS